MAKEKWTKETVEKEAKKYKVKWHFATNCSGGYKFAVRHNLIKNYYWFEQKSKPIGYWTKETCEKESKKYKSRSEFKEKSSGAYESSRINNWLNDFIWLENKNIPNGKFDNIYGYFFDDKTVYIGRTLKPNKRDIDHRKESRCDSVFKYSKHLNVEIPPMIIIEKELTIEDGKKREQFWIDYYRNNGYNILNKQKGGGIGSLAFNKYTKEKILEEASKYKTRKEFKTKSPNFYYHAWKIGLLKEIIPSVQVTKRGFWQIRKNVEEKSKEFETLEEFSKKSKGAYDAAVKGGYLKELTWLKRKRKEYKKR